VLGAFGDGQVFGRDGGEDGLAVLECVGLDDDLA
jgi:hypothetical protein